MALSRNEDVLAPGRWHDAVTGTLLDGDIDIPHPQSFHGSVKARPFADLTFIETDADMHSSSRRLHHIRSTDDPYYLITLQLSGTFAITQDQRTAVLSAGEFAAWDSARPASLESSNDCTSLCLKFPQKLLHAPADRLSECTVRRTDADEGLGPAVWSMITTLNRTMDTVPNVNRYNAVRGVVNLIESLLTSPTHAGTAPEPRRDLLDRMQEYIETHLGEPTLSPQSVADAHFISVRHLHALFHGTGASISTRIRDHRLDRCKTELTDPALANVPVSAIARRWGFRGASHFGQVFKLSTGCSPTEFRSMTTERRGPRQPTL